METEGALFAVADLAEAALGGSGGGSGLGDDAADNGDEKIAAAAACSPSTKTTTTAAAARRVLSFLSSLDECLAWAPAETAVRVPRCCSGGKGNRKENTGGGGRLLFFLPSLWAALGLSSWVDYEARMLWLDSSYPSACEP